MRTMLKVTIPVEAGNAAIKNGTLAQIVGGVLLAEPLFLGLNASVEFLPVMDVADMQAGVAKAAAAV